MTLAAERPSPLRWVAMVVLAIAVVASASPWFEALAIEGFPAFVVAAAVLSVVLPYAVAATGRPAVLSFAISAAGWLGLTVVALVRGDASVGDLVPGLVETPSRLLSEALPFTGPRSVVVLPLLLVWLTGAVAGETAARRAAPVPPVVAPLLGFCAAHALTAGGSTAPLAWTAVLAASVLTVVALRQADLDRRGAPVTRPGAEPDHARRRRLVAALGGAVVLAVTATVAAAASPAGRAEPAAPNREAPLDDLDLDDPIGTLALLRDAALAEPLYAVTTDAPVAGYLPVATLDAYDGRSWTFDRVFEPTGGHVPVPEGAVAPGSGRRRVDVEVLGEPVLPFLPYAERTVEVRGAEVAYDPATGMLRPATTLDAGSRYDLTVAGTDRRVEALAGAPIEPSAMPLDTALPPELAADLDTLLARLEAQTGTVAAPTTEFLGDLVSALREHNRRVPPRAAADDGGEAATAGSTGGTSLAAVADAVLTRHQGQSEQFATLVALVARHLGVPARVTTGFRLGPADAADAHPAGTVEVGHEDVWTWVEVPVAGHGWVVVDPTPAAVGDPQPESFATTSTTSTTVPIGASAVPDPDSGNALADPVDIQPPAGSERAPVLLWTAGVLGLALVLALAARWSFFAVRRHRRRHRGGPCAEVLGAWREVLSVLRQVGAPTMAAQSASEVAARVRSQFGPEAGTAAQELARLTNAAVYSRVADPAPADAADAWRCHEVVRRSVRRQATRRRRLSTWWQHRRPTRGRMRHASTTAA